MAERTSPLINTATTLGKVVAFFLGSAVAGALVAGTMVPLAVGASKATEVAAGAYDSIEIPTENAAIAQPSTLLDREGNVLAKFFVQNRKSVSLKNISPWMQKAIISIEDERFYEHGGVDARGIARALVSNLSGAGKQGASTITQQYVANLNVNNQQAEGLSEDEIARNGNKDISDKVKEIKWANEIETKMSKDQILQGYLNLVPFAGATYGVEAASERWFSKSAKDLNIAEAALLAGMVQRPTLYNPEVNPKAATQRRNVVLGAMLKTGAITRDEYNKAVKSKIAIDPSEDTSGCATAEGAAYFCQYVFNEVKLNPIFGKTVQERQSLLFRGGLTIKTTLDPRLQKAAETQVVKTVPIGDPGGLGAALVTRENSTGEVLAMAQNTKFGTGKGKTKNQYTQYNFTADSAHGGSGGFQGGSTAKPWTALAWIEAGHSMNDAVDATRDDYGPTTQWKASCVYGGTVQAQWAKLGNSINGMKKSMSAKYGLYWSVNTATVAEAYKLDTCKIAEQAERLGLLEGQRVTVAKRDEQNQVVYETNKAGKKVVATETVAVTPKVLASPGPSFVLGSQNVTPLAQARAFSTFAQEGVQCENTVLLEVKQRNGKAINLPETECKRLYDKEVIAELNGTLTQIAKLRIVKGSFGASVGGKTGTNNNASSTWFAGYTSGLTTVSWFGNKDGTVKKGLNNGAELRGVKMYGKDSMTFAGPLWTQYMAKVYDLYPHETIERTDLASPSATGGKAASTGTGTGKGTGSGSGSTKSADPSSSAKSTDGAKSTDSTKSPEKTKEPEKTKTPEKTKEPVKTKQPEKTKTPEKTKD
ncbi:transglycosylase domain-containing protein [Galactobacter valiniphilus]|uniref:transglycosylase domain-containing protein n=1 Tax=Galactobacter valiniphilus TaxID=2676122 RepID=UPI003735FD62